MKGKYLQSIIFFIMLHSLNQCVNTSDNVNTSGVLENQYSDDYQVQYEYIRMAALKGFHGKIIYVGSNSDYDFFYIRRVGKYFRIKQEKTNLSCRHNINSLIKNNYEVGFDNIIQPSGAGLAR